MDNHLPRLFRRIKFEKERNRKRHFGEKQKVKQMERFEEKKTNKEDKQKN